MDEFLDGSLDTENAGRWVEAQCEYIGISVSRVAREARVSPTTIYRWKKGHTEPYWHSFKRIKLVIDGYWERKRGGL